MGFDRSRKATPPRERLTNGLEQGCLSAVAAVLAWLPPQMLGLREGFWAAVTAVAVAQTQLNAAASTARDQFAGAAIGGIVAAIVSLAAGPGLIGFVISLVIAIIGCWLCNVASAARLAGITAVIIFLVPHQGSAVRMTLSRVGEVGWGIFVAILLVRTAAGLRDRLEQI
jgi:uncharacterized membrane protein YgaE (UPF0421/DUF939 family)